MPIINHAEDECLRSKGLMNEGIVSVELGLDGNIDLAESIMVHRDIELATYTKSKLHVPHVSSSKALKHIRDIKLSNDKITAEVTPHHLYFNEEAIRNFDTNFKVGPPIRTEKDRIDLISAIKDGIIDCIATDHAPHTVEDKETTFDLASFGMIGLESCFGAVNKVLVKQNDLTLLDLIKLLSTNPRNIMKFNSDLFKIGTEAEITILDPDKEYVFGKSNIKSLSSNTPFIGEELIGKVLYTVSKNKIYKSSKIISE